MRIVVKITREPAGTYRAWVPMLPGCAVREASYEAALGRIDQLVRSYLYSLDVIPGVMLQPQELVAG